MDDGFRYEVVRVYTFFMHSYSRKLLQPQSLARSLGSKSYHRTELTVDDSYLSAVNFHAFSRCSFMHCRALCPHYGNLLRFNAQIGLRYSLEQSRWVRVGYDHSFQTRAATGEQKSPAFGSLENQKAWADKRRNIIKTRLEDNQDIYIDDLSATLEAHRERNRALTIRRVETVFDERSLSFLRPLSLDLRNLPSAEESESKNVLGGSPSLDGFQQEGSQQIAASETDRNKKAGADIADNLYDSSRPIKAWQHWPADSIQYKEILKIKPSDKVTEPSVLEYVPLSPRPCNSWLLKGKVLPDDLQWPWLAYVEGYEGDGPERYVLSIMVTVSILIFELRLQKEIKAFETYTRLTPSEKSASEAVITDVEAMTELAFPSSTLSVVGSHRTGLATPTSDIDFSLSPPSPKQGNHKSRTKIREVSQKILRGLQRHLHKSTLFREVELVFGSIPIVRAVHHRTGLRVQISTQSPDRYDRDFTAAYLAEFPTLRPIFMVLRYALEMRGLNTPFEGGLGSYSIFMMIVAALKQASGEHARDDHANHLLHVLHFYASADLYKVGFCVDPPRTFTKAGNNLFPLNHRKPYLLCLQDPADATNDLGRKAYAIKHVQKVFERARADIVGDMLEWERKTVEDRKGIQGGLLNRLLRANYESLEFGRRRMCESGNTKAGLNFKRPSELKPPDFSRLPSLKGLRKKGWADEVNAERKRRGRQKREVTAKRRALLVEKRKNEANIQGAEE